MSICQPPALLTAFADRIRRDYLHEISIYSSLACEHAAGTVLSPDLCDQVMHLSWFAYEADRTMTTYGRSSFVPSYLHQIPRFCADFMDIDIVTPTVSPRTKRGSSPSGLEMTISVAARHCRHLIAEVNRNMSRVFGDSLLHVSEVSAIAEHTRPLMEVCPAGEKSEDKRIGEIIAAEIPD